MQAFAPTSNGGAGKKAAVERMEPLEQFVNESQVVADRLQAAASAKAMQPESELTINTVLDVCRSMIRHRSRYAGASCEQRCDAGTDPRFSRTYIEDRKDYGLLEEPGIGAIWSNRADGSFVFSMPEAGLMNAKGREWRKHAMKGEAYESTVYISAITKRPCVTLSRAIVGENGETEGVIGIDVGIRK